MSAGGGFGPACDNGCGVSYSIAGENEFTFHISASKKSGTTSALRFKDLIIETLEQMKLVLAVALKNEKDEAIAKKPLKQVHDPRTSSAQLKQVHDPTTSVIGSPLLTPEPLLMSKK